MPRVSVSIFPASAALLLAACAGEMEDGPRLEDLRLSGWRTSTETRRCLPAGEIVERRVIDLDTITLTLADGSVWRNDLPLSCPGLLLSETFLLLPEDGEICSDGSLQVSPEAGIGALCGLGPFRRLEHEQGDAGG